MSQKHTLNSFALAVVLAAAIFVVAFALFVFVADYAIMGSIFMALLIALLSGIVLFLGFGSPVERVAPVQAGSAPSMPAAAPAAPAATPSEPSKAEAEAAEAAADRQEAADAAAAIAARKQADAEAAAARKAAEEAEAAEKAAAEAEAARKAAEAEAEAKRAAEAKAAETPAPPATDAAGIPDYDGDGKLEGTEEGTRPAGLDAPRDGNADDLKQIKGIGPKLEVLCNSLGFWHFDQVAAWTADEVAWVDANLKGFKGRVTRDEWVSQAKVLAAGGETEFSKRVEDGDVY